MRRRTFLGRLRTVFLAMTAGAFNTASGASNAGPDGSTLAAVVDALVPADQDPGAVDAGIATQLSQVLESDPWARTIYVRGLRLLNELARDQYRAAFSDLPLAVRGELLQSLLFSGGPNGRQFFVRVRSDVLNRFYTSPAGREMLGYTLPNQGYIDDGGSEA